MLEELRQNYLDAILDTNRSLAFKAIDTSLSDGHSAETVLFGIIIPVMEELAEIIRVGHDATLAQLYLASQISAEVTDQLAPLIVTEKKVTGKIVIGTAFEDFHGLGKKIVSGCLKSRMVEVIDLGLNVSPEKYVETAISQNAKVIGISSMMLHTARGENGPIKVRQLLKESKKEDEIFLVVGGAPYRFHPELYKQVGADAWAENGITASKIITELIKKGRMK
ncbi:MAG: cobalamin-dependent protein [Desulfamplus sp.]|nr:cobalamin-dependent protein [Desulfamplus sp.]